jgi:hypothetical protein
MGIRTAKNAPLRTHDDGLQKSVGPVQNSVGMKKGSRLSAPLFAIKLHGSIVLVRNTRRTLAGSVSHEAAAASCIDANYCILNGTETLGAG